MATATKDWDSYVVEAEDMARCEGFRDLRDRILERAAPQRGETVVDVGAGTGLLTLTVAATVERVWAIDISPPMCEYLRTKAMSAGCDNVTVAVASATSLPLVDASADVVVSHYCFHELDHADSSLAS
jgi:ubiquinone/menaquinone biosynthesis C-methylase UbiE